MLNIEACQIGRQSGGKTCRSPKGKSQLAGLDVKAVGKHVDSVESLKLAEEIEKRAAQKDIVMDILIEVNMAAEESKFGVKPEDTEALLREIAKMQHIRVRGLMTVAPFVENQEENREVFRQMRELLVDMNGKKIDNIKMDTLSMGMTGDYEVAIEEGATIVRVGTGIFGERYYPNKG